MYLMWQLAHRGKEVLVGNGENDTEVDDREQPGEGVFAGELHALPRASLIVFRLPASGDLHAPLSHLRHLVGEIGRAVVVRIVRHGNEADKPDEDSEAA